MTSPMALSSPFKKRTPSSSLSATYNSAASYLSAVSEADARSRTPREASPTPTSTPALSMSSSITVTSSGTRWDEEGGADSNELLLVPSEPPTSEQVFSTVHTEFGHCVNEKYRYRSEHKEGAPVKVHVIQDPPYYILLSTYLSYLLMIIFGHMRDFFAKRFRPSAYKHLMPHDGYASLNSDFDSFYSRRFKGRMDDCFSQPVTGVAGRTVVCLDRYSTDYNQHFTMSGKRWRALNISSYNYLGFAQARGGCADAVEEGMKRYGVSTLGPRLAGGTTDLHVQAEALVARFVGMEDALLVSMGFATNSTIVPSLVSKGCLVISDEHNHASIRMGVRFSGANVLMFKHNDMESLENVLRESISQGQPKTHRPWKKILLMVEGLYSMEGTLVNLPRIIELKKKYKFYLWVDEAHSIGALGPNGRGVVDYFHANPRDIDILMGTFTKSFGAQGGYIAASKAIIDRLRISSYSPSYAESMSPPVITQILASTASIMGVTSALTSSSSSTLRLSDAASLNYPGRAPASALPTWMNLPPIMSSGEEGAERLRRIAFNSRYLARGLQKLGFITYGHADSPIVPLLVFHPGKMLMFHRFMRLREVPIVVVVVGYPATALVTGRVRFCVSAAHTKADIDTILTGCDEVGDILGLKLAKGERWSLKKITDNAVNLVNQEEWE